MRADPLKRLRRSHEILKENGIPHGLIGGWAVIAWGRVRVTRDQDWLAEFSPRGLGPLLKALEPLGRAQWRPPGQDDSIAGLIRVTPDDASESAVDILLAKKAADLAALRRCVQVDLGGFALPAIRAEDIIAMKLQAGGGLDLDDARELLKSPATELDEDILQDACGARRVTGILTKMRREPV
ncbi:MAG: hypothetical protein HYZ75_00870 [Elusimicrobia bacterium]|nr:hypothetical protein [Elusimicrobiota bacterium]